MNLFRLAIITILLTATLPAWWLSIYNEEIKLSTWQAKYPHTDSQGYVLPFGAVARWNLPRQIKAREFQEALVSKDHRFLYLKHYHSLDVWDISSKQLVKSFVSKPDFTNLSSLLVLATLYTHKWHIAFVKDLAHTLIAMHQGKLLELDPAIIQSSLVKSNVDTKYLIDEDHTNLYVGIADWQQDPTTGQSKNMAFLYHFNIKTNTLINSIKTSYNTTPAQKKNEKAFAAYEIVNNVKSSYPRKKYISPMLKQHIDTHKDDWLVKNLSTGHTISISLDKPGSHSRPFFLSENQVSASRFHTLQIYDLASNRS